LTHNRRLADKSESDLKPSSLTSWRLDRLEKNLEKSGLDIVSLDSKITQQIAELKFEIQASRNEIQQGMQTLGQTLGDFHRAELNHHTTLSWLFITIAVALASASLFLVPPLIEAYVENYRSSQMADSPGHAVKDRSLDNLTDHNVINESTPKESPQNNVLSRLLSVAFGPPNPGPYW